MENAIDKTINKNSLKTPKKGRHLTENQTLTFRHHGDITVTAAHYLL